MLRDEAGTAVRVAAPGEVAEMADVARPTQREFLAGLRDVACDLPALVTAPLYRRWHLRWGATAAEVAGSMPGDALLPRAQFRATRAITIDAPPEAVWPWLVQVGCQRAGFYSNDLLDNLGRPSATTILSGLQHLQAGQWVPMSPAATPTDRTALKVLLGVVLMEFGDFAMLRRMLRGIKTRAESLAPDASRIGRSV
jgi:hypothetical protein